MTPEAPGPERPGASPTPAGYVIGAVMAVLIVVGIYFALTAGGNQDPGAAHLATPSSGSTNGVEPDERSGTRVAVGSLSAQVTARAAGCKLEFDLPDEGQKHLSRDDPAPHYGTVPATSGPHIGPPLQQADGAYRETPQPEDVVHSLEHGRVAIQYDPDLPEKAQLQLKGLYDTAYSGALLFSNPDMPYAVAATAWTSLLGCSAWRGAKTIDAVRAFAIEVQGQGPEDLENTPPVKGPSFTSLGKP